MGRHHCERCRFVMGSFYADDEVYMRLRCDWACPMPHVCMACDEIEFELDKTRVLPKLVVT